MQYHELSVEKRKTAKRVGRGISAGQGKTAGRGTKGQSSRTGGKRRPGFEGGQTPLMMRIPKLRGFTSHRMKAENVYTGQLDTLKGEINNYTLFAAGLVSSPYVKVKLVTKGELTKSVDVHLQAASNSAIAAIEKAGGSFKVVGRPMRESKKTKS
ncbi:MAG TPA: 50S ribosomal protein L15 [Candidatus Saccharibacteria bacterium]|nr:50S ribosomal protein L15 [Candidatus Saccharibacteria bacterium]MCB9817208.1 50S ribosomal protein L15 [Candidatus Nomurabacteria bacterium]HPD99312.1 50S ribosomal protein L15 [Candidatus Saccharibacteria bacterium]HPR10345.1 50S ribosomal protein L15 [Candidatus Saccharibacteria bacterium]